MNERPDGFDKKKPPTAAEAFREAQRAEQVMRSSQYGSGQGGVFSGQKPPQKAEKASRRDRMLAKLAAAITEALGDRIEAALATQPNQGDKPVDRSVSQQNDAAHSGGTESPELRSPLVNNPPTPDEPITIGVDVGAGVPSVQVDDVSPNWEPQPSDTQYANASAPAPETPPDAIVSQPAIEVPQAYSEQYVQPWEPQRSVASSERDNALPEVRQGENGQMPAEVVAEASTGPSAIPAEVPSIAGDAPQVASPVASVDVERTRMPMEQSGLDDPGQPEDVMPSGSIDDRGSGDPVMVGVNVDVDLPSADQPDASGEWSPNTGQRPPSLAGIPDSELPDVPGMLRGGEPMRTLDELPIPEKQSWEPRSSESPAQRDVELDTPAVEPFAPSSQEPGFHGSVPPSETVSFDQFDPPGRATVDVQGRQPLEMDELVREYAESNQLLHESTASSIRSIIAAMQTLSEELYQVSTAMDRLEDTYR